MRTVSSHLRVIVIQKLAGVDPGGGGGGPGCQDPIPLL